MNYRYLLDTAVETLRDKIANINKEPMSGPRSHYYCSGLIAALGILEGITYEAMQCEYETRLP